MQRGDCLTVTVPAARLMDAAAEDWGIPIIVTEETASVIPCD
ncbi:hypothetical protein DB32_002123 [Sandaracinus amylolyticus]|uniref:Uncharacterized protein n=2 Tax=Sandaracinus amylolyticus TaxID=927083 RepID=A0A0F6SEC9_9BACT|nr:hypothetical protein DB32_002123 [Sandaracinus amylolyticus]